MKTKIIYDAMAWINRNHSMTAVLRLSSGPELPGQRNTYIINNSIFIYLNYKSNNRKNFIYRISKFYSNMAPTSYKACKMHVKLTFFTSWVATSPTAFLIDVTISTCFLIGWIQT